MAELAHRIWAPDCRPSAAMPDGPVELWLAAFGDDGDLMGAGPVTDPVTWHWKDGMLRCRYGTVQMSILRRGHPRTAMIIAVSPQARKYSPVFRIELHIEPHDGHPVKPGMSMTIVDGDIGIAATIPVT